MFSRIAYEFKDNYQLKNSATSVSAYVNNNYFTFSAFQNVRISDRVGFLIV